MAEGHKDYSGTPLPKKLGIREGTRVLRDAARRTGSTARWSRFLPAFGGSVAPGATWTS